MQGAALSQAPGHGYKRAVVAIADKILFAIYHVLSQQVSYNFGSGRRIGGLHQSALEMHIATGDAVAIALGGGFV